MYLVSIYISNIFMNGVPITNEIGDWGGGKGTISLKSVKNEDSKEEREGNRTNVIKYLHKFLW